MQSTSETITHVTLIQRAQAGNDSPAWDEVLRYYEPFIRRALVGMRIEGSEVDDVCQEVLARLWKELVNYTRDEKRARFRTWLTRLIRNVAINEYWKRKRDKRVGSQGLESLANHKGESSELEQLVEAEWQRYVIGLGMQRVEKIFSGKAVEVFLRSQEGEPIEEISKSLGLTLQSTYVLRSRVKKRLVDEVIQIRRNLELGGAQP